MKNVYTLFFSLFVFFTGSFSALAADETADFEQNSAAQSGTKNVVLSQSSPIVGYQPLTVAGQEIEATYLEETLGERHGAVVLLHDRGEPLESYGVITPLRHQLPQYGWSTLTLALDYPFEPEILLSVSAVGDASDAEATKPAETIDTEKTDTTANKDEKSELPAISNEQRIAAAIALLQAKDIKRIIFIGHGAGGNLAVEILDNETTPIQALILVGTPALTTDEVFKTMNHPILDLYGNNDLEGVVEAVNKRKVMMKRAGNIRYSARQVIGANHLFSGLQNALVDNIRGWLKVTFIKPKNPN